MKNSSFLKEDIIHFQDGIIQREEFSSKLSIAAVFWDNGFFYIGNWKNEHLFGKGILIYPDGTFLFSNFEKNKITGNGIIRFFNGEIILGKWEENNLGGICFYYKKNENCWIKMEINGKILKIISKEIVNKPNDIPSIMADSKDFSTLLMQHIFDLIIHDCENFSATFAHLFFNVNSSYLGFLSKNQPNGLGVFFDKENKCICMGEFKNGSVNNLGRTIREKEVLDGSYENGNLEGRILYYDRINDISKVGVFKMNFIEEIEVESTGYNYEALKGFKQAYHKKSPKYYNMTIDCPFFEVLTCLPFQSDANPDDSSKKNHITSFQSFSPIKGESKQFPITTFRSQKICIEGRLKEEKGKRKDEKEKWTKKKEDAEDKEQGWREKEVTGREIKGEWIDEIMKNEEKDREEKGDWGKIMEGYVEEISLKKENVEVLDNIKQDFNENIFHFFEEEKKFDRHGFKRKWINQFEEYYFEKEIKKANEKSTLTFKEILENYKSIRDHNNFLKNSQIQEFESLKSFERLEEREKNEEIEIVRINKEEKDEQSMKSEEFMKKKEKINEGGTGEEEEEADNEQKAYEDDFLNLYFELKQEKKGEKDEWEGKEKEKRVLIEIVSFLRKEQKKKEENERKTIDSELI